MLPLSRGSYVGFEEGGQLTEAVRRRPYAVILFGVKSAAALTLASRVWLRFGC